MIQYTLPVIKIQVVNCREGGRSENVAFSYILQILRNFFLKTAIKGQFLHQEGVGGQKIGILGRISV